MTSTMTASTQDLATRSERPRAGSLWLVLMLLAVLSALTADGAWADAPRTAPVPVPRMLDGETPVAAPAEPLNGVDIARQLRLTGDIGWMLLDLESGTVVDAHAATKSFAPASVAKLPTALYALASLGPNHRFETRLFARGPLRDGVLAGDLVLVGGGDPELDSDALADLADDLRTSGIRSVSGRFLVDGGSGVRVQEIDPLQPVDVAYNPAISGLNLNFNRVFLEWQSVGAQRRVQVTAPADEQRPAVTAVRAEILPGSVPFSHELDQAGELWRVSAGVLGRSGARWLPVKRPEIYAGDVLRALAGARGVRLGLPQALSAPLGDIAEGARQIARRQSRPLAEILRDMLRFSTNLTAEVVGVAVAEARGEQLATLAQSAALMNAWAGRLAGAAPGDPRLKFVNHSGLTIESRVSPERMVQFLQGAARLGPRPSADAVAAGAMPVPGPAPALLRPYVIDIENDPLDLSSVEVRAKTGTMDRIRGLAGYLAIGPDRAFAFAIFTNDLAGRGAPRRGVDAGWMRRARAFERRLLRGWVRRVAG
ncbi:MAG: D-alanyl-D-alanine carboxypeptidase/D-alanyl-D-alanine-endopeptidase [Pikeienuella sp.]